MPQYDWSRIPATHEGPGVTIFGILILLMLGFICLLITVLTTWAYCRICLKAGYSWALGLLMLVPVANLVLLLFLAFSTWPIQKEMEKLKLQQPPVRVV